MIFLVHGLATDAAATNLLPGALSRSNTELQGSSRPQGMPTDLQLEAAGAVVGEVLIEPEEIFDTAASDDDTVVFRAANRLHPRTRPSTIATLLLFDTGDPYSAKQLEESERLLRTTRYLSDATVRPIAYHDGKVDVQVRTRDVWTFNPGVSFGRGGGANAGGIELEELNLLGTGTQVGVGYHAGVDRESLTFSYRDRQLGDSWWRLAAAYSVNSDGGGHELTLEQPFYAIGTPWAAGFTTHEDDRIDQRYDLGESIDEYRTQARYASAYGGWATALSGERTRRWTAGFTYDDSQFGATGDTAELSGVPADRRLAYPWLGVELLEDRYLETRNRDRIGRVEDVPVGWRLAARLGYSSPAFGADREALVIDAGASKGYAFDRDRLGQISATLSGRYEDGAFVNTVIGGAARFDWRQSPRRLAHVSLQADVAHDPDLDTTLQLGGDNGLRGYPLRYQGGEGRWLLTAEQRWYTNWYPFRLFQVGAAAFFDVGATWGENPYGSPSQGVLKDVGVGLRLGNTRSALGNVLHVDLAMPLDGGSDISNVQLLITTKASF